ncbi:DEAD/DEAH box helicase family protein [Heyndrickxia coagulans]|uniref:DEAD/DEAH box helicase family protein n=1 Tax=Heyndrickxia coagulans TaxID=1398 RepID=UPI0002110679|nr:DEAD/DEAH box helicase family protein [Heyndrickxia coagulans]AEH54990.1 P-loop containing nucleoside triphosphate hydrolase [Heyndrickxia coagulans 2-6]
MIDFGKLLDAQDDEKPIFPKEIFESLVRNEQFSYLRGDQERVLEKWFNQRELKDNIIKMNTGGGKTTVGLLQLQSSINEGVGPALYLCLDNQLIEQVLDDAKSLGINCVTFDESNEVPIEFLNNEAILVTTFQKLFNARSVFGILGDASKPAISIGCLVIDDAHAALNKAREVFSLKFNSSSKQYKHLIEMFKGSLISQSLGTATDIIDGRDKYSILMVPYWSWIERLESVTKFLSEYDENDLDMKFKWPLIRDSLEQYFMLVSAASIELVPKCLPIHKIPSYAKAKRRIFMSATLNDDFSLIKDFDIDKNSVKKPLEPDTFSDVGEKLILSPYNIDRSLNSLVLAKALSKIEDFNIVTLVTSNYRAELWKKHGFFQPNSSNIIDTIKTLKESNGNHVVLSNRYDGIDLPDNACRILIIDGLPSAGSLFEQFSLYARPSSKIMRLNQAQKIEQGMGRAVRSVNDYSVILLLGADLVSLVSTKEFQESMSPQTVTQIKLGSQIIELLKQEEGKPLKLIGTAMKQVLNRDKNWIKLHKSKINKTTRQQIDNELIEYAEGERKAFELAMSSQYSQAADVIRDIINKEKEIDIEDEAWYLQLAASYLYKADRSRAMELQLSAHKKNSYLLRPPEGTSYIRLTRKKTIQSIRVKEFIEKFSEPNAMVLKVSTLLENIRFSPETSTQFEQAFYELGIVLGFEAQQPEREFGMGPDILWNIYEDEYLIIEAKNEVKTSREEIFKSEIEQLSNSMNWFEKEYPDKSGIPVLIHPSFVLHREAFSPKGAVVLNEYNLITFVNNTRDFFIKLSERESSSWDIKEITSELKNYKLERKDIKNYFINIK